MMAMSHRATKHTSARDRGYTLPEVLITILIMGTLASVLTGVIAVVLRNTPSTEARAEDARSVLGLVTWLPQDVDSTPPTGFDVDPTTPSGCGTSPGRNILHLSWTETLGTTVTTYISNYRHVGTATDGFSLERISCNGLGTPPFAGGASLSLTGDLPALPVGWAPGDAPLEVTVDRDPITNDVTLVSFEITTINGKIVRTDSAPKNPQDTLPTTTLPSWVPPTPTTLPYTNNPPSASSHAITAPAATTTIQYLTVSDPDGDSLAVTLEPASIPSGWLVSLSGLTMSIRPDSGHVGTTRVISYTVDDQHGGVTTGTVTVTVLPASTPTTLPAATTTTTTTTTTTAPPLPPCSVTAASLSRLMVKNVQADGSPGQVNVGVLFKPITVTATTNIYCTGLEIRYDTGGVNSPGFANMTQTGPTTWSVTLPGRDEGSSETWADGPHPIEFHAPTGGPLGPTQTLTVT